MCQSVVRVNDAIGKMPLNPVGYLISWSSQEQVQGGVNRRNAQRNLRTADETVCLLFLFGSGSAGLGFKKLVRLHA